MKSSYVAKAFHARVNSVLAANPTSPPTPVGPIRQDIPGDNFEAGKIPKQWIEPRLSESTHPNDSAVNEETDSYVFQIRCFVKEQRKGGRFNDGVPDLERLVDIAREMIDVSAGAPTGLVIEDETSPDPIKVGTIQLGEVTITRQYRVSETIAGHSINDLDIATVRAEAYVSGGGC